MTKYINKTRKMKTVFYKDGSASFLMRGQSVTTDKEIDRVQEGVTVVEVADTEAPSFVADGEI